MPTRTRPLPSPDPARRAVPARYALAVAALGLFAGCMVGPFPAEPSAEEPDATVEPAAPRSKAATEPGKIPSCTRVWSDALADSAWSCPDPRPPAPAFGRSG